MTIQTMYRFTFLMTALLSPGHGYAQSMLYGGEGISSSSTATTHGCSAGFTVRRENSDRQYMVTAGHCARVLGNPWYDVNQGWREDSNYIGFTDWTVSSQTINDVFVDLALIELPNNKAHGAQPAVTYDTDFESFSASDNPLGRDGLRLLITDIIEEQDLFVGQEVCITGASTGTACGEITHMRTDPSNSYITNICLRSGDSGGAIYTVDRDSNDEPTGTAQAVGILRGGVSNTCDDNSGYATFIPLSRLSSVTGEQFESPLRVVHITKRNAIGYALDGNVGAVDGQSIYLYNADQNNVDQQWIEFDRGDGYFSYQKYGTDHCIDGGNEAEVPQDVYLWTCTNTNENQQWSKVSTGGDSYQLVKRNASSWAINGGENGMNGQNVNLWNSSESSQNLQWIITPVD